MPSMPTTPGGYRMVGLVLMGSSIVTCVIAYLIDAGTLPLPEEIRPLIAGSVAAVALFDVLAGIWFFRKGQAS